MEVGRGKVRDWVASIAACMRASQAEREWDVAESEGTEGGEDGGR